MMTAIQPPNVWSQMSYVPPRGQCNFKPSIMSAKCPCLRFMLHPLKSSSSYECDGCNHHASFHSMENKTEDEIRKRWEQEAREKKELEDLTAERPRKRPREIEYTSGSTKSVNARLLDQGRLTPDEPEELRTRSVSNVSGTSSSRGRVKAKAGRSTGGRAAAAKAKSRVTEILDDDDIELLD